MLHPWYPMLIERDGLGRAIQNIDRVSNVTFLPAGGNIKEIITFDNEPGNELIDQLIDTETDSKLKYDKND